MNLNAILTSTVIATVVSGLFAFLQSYRNSRITKITDERKQWREDIRKISENLSEFNNEDNIDEKELTQVLTSLKVKINAYGNTCKFDESLNSVKNKNKPYRQNHDPMITEYYKHDGHIWKVIHEIESKQCKNRKTGINKLIEYLSFLLKYDWDRSKDEVCINSQMVYSRAIFSLSIISIVLFAFCIGDIAEPISISKITCIIPLTILMIFLFLASSMPKYNYFEKAILDKSKIFSATIIIIIIIVIIIGFFDIISIYSQDISLLSVPLLILIIAISMNCGTITRQIDIDKQYIDILLEYDCKQS